MNERTESGLDLNAFARTCHPACIACRDKAEGGLELRFTSTADGSVEAGFACDWRYQGYPDRVHGGIVAMLLDAAMTHCLFARRLHGVTARLTVRYRDRVEIGVPGVVRAHLVRDAHGLCDLEAELIQSAEVKASAEARFMCAPNRGDRVVGT
jgi:acyl-coenzyme A thioesterase PaaI-like protein